MCKATETACVRVREEREMRRGLRCRRMGLFNSKIKQINKNHPEGEKQAGRQRTVAVTITHTHTTNQHKTADTRRLNREINKGDTSGATETMIS